jgi:hypothetical protein
MEIYTSFGTYLVTETATGLMAENIKTHGQLFIEGRWLPSPDCTMDVQLLVQAIENEYNFQQNIE